MKKLLRISILIFILLCVMTSCKHDHKWSEWQISKAATCTQDGIKEKICSCGEKREQVIFASGHTFGDWSTTQKMTCTVNGLEERSCTCGEKETRTILASGHAFGDWNTTKKVTCTVNGLEERSCTCGEKETRTILAPGHTFGDWSTTKKATCTVNGSKERKCACGKKETATISAAHSWKNATCLEAKKCEKCNLTQGTALGHTCSIGTCARCKVTIYPKVNLPSAPYLVSYNSVNFKITEITYYFNSSGDLIVSFSGEVIYSRYGAQLCVRCRVIDKDGYLVTSDSWLKYSVNTGDKLKGELVIDASWLEDSSEYTIEIL